MILRFVRLSFKQYILAQLIMTKISLFWEFHKSTLLLNWVFSLGISVVVWPWSFPIITMTGGPLFSLFYKEISRNNEYYFYYNLGLTKSNLIVMSMVFNVLTGILLLFILSLW